MISTWDVRCWSQSGYEERVIKPCHIRPHSVDASLVLAQVGDLVQGCLKVGKFKAVFELGVDLSDFVPYLLAQSRFDILIMFFIGLILEGCEPIPADWYHGTDGALADMTVISLPSWLLCTV